MTLQIFLNVDKSYIQSYKESKKALQDQLCWTAALRWTGCHII